MTDGTPQKPVDPEAAPKATESEQVREEDEYAEDTEHQSAGREQGSGTDA